MSSGDSPTHYKILEVEETASSADITAAYRRLANEYHPDRLPPELRDRRVGRDAVEAFQRVRKAYDVLSKPKSRKDYDRALAEVRRGSAYEQRTTPAGPPPPRARTPRSYSPGPKFSGRALLASVLLAVALVFSILIVVVTSRDPRDTAIEPGADAGGSPAEFLANALVIAAEAGDEAKVASLLASGANPNSTTSQTIDGFSRHVSALSVAVARGRTRIVRRLLHAGANPNGSGASGASLLADAIAANQTTIATLLRSAGARLPANASSLPTADGARPGDGLQTDSTLGRAVAIPGYIAKEHAEVLRHWLVQNPRFRIADYSDCACDSDLPAIRRAYSNQDLYYVADDLNGDGELDFAVVLIDLAKQSPNAALAIFNGPLTKGVGPALLADTMRAPSGAVLFYQAEEHKLMLGKWESDGIDTVVPNGSRYSLR